MDDRFSRTRALVGDDGVERLANARVAVIGLGGVGGYALEALARAGIGNFILVDADVVEPTNLNRQILALDSAIGKPKVDVARDHVAQINPDARVETYQVFLTPENVEAVLPPDVKYAVDAIDHVPAKVALIVLLKKRGVLFVSCMGAGSKLDATKVRIADLFESKGCPLARTVRQRLRKLGIEKDVRCVYSDEDLGGLEEAGADLSAVRPIRGTISYMPGVVGLMAASVIIRDILEG